MIKSYMHNRERQFAMRDDDRVAHPFGWGLEYILDNANGVDPRQALKEFSKHTVENSDAFFFEPKVSDYTTTHDTLTWTSGITTNWDENNTVYAKYFPADNDRRSAVLVLPHWN